MSERERIDEEIGRLVRSVRSEVPAGLEEKARAAAIAEVGKRRERRLVLRWALVPTVAAALLLAALVVPQAVRKVAPAPIALAEIRTEFEIPGKDIKIVFFQKPDFKLFQED
jgi:hypothetical protein